MQQLTAAHLLRIWERGVARHPVERGVVIVAEAEPEATPAALRDLPIGMLNERLLAVRERTFGPHLTATVGCAACGARAELSFSTADARTGAGGTAGEQVVEVKGRTLHLRPLTTHDLLSAADCPDAGEARRVLARRCVRFPGAAEGAPVLDDALVDVVARHLEGADPGAVRMLEATCPECGAAGEHEFDVAAFLWAEIEAEALQLLRDVHVIARGYGWPEGEILALTPLRRRAYLELLA